MVTEVSEARTGYSSNSAYTEDPQYEATTDMKASNLSPKQLNIKVLISLYDGT
jgi:hypothetical protein